MDVKDSYSKGKVKGPTSITAALTSAFLEWVLMVFLFIDGAFAYLVTRFAQYCQLQLPCLLCSRLDHVLGGEKSGFYWDLICSSHKSKISSLVLCHHHHNLVDVHGMCENCLFSFATANKSNAETYRLLVGKLGAAPHLAENPKISDKPKICYCCKEEYRSRGNAQKLILLARSGSDTVEHDAPPLSVNNGTMGADSKPEYKKVKVCSDSESDAACSDADSTRSLLGDRVSSKDSYGRCLHPEPQNFTLTDYCATEKPVVSGSVAQPSLIDQDIDSKDRDFASSKSSADGVGLGLDEVNLQQAALKADDTPQSDHVPFGQVPSSNITADLARESCYPEVSKTGSVVSKSESLLFSNPEPSPANLQTAGSFDLGDAYKLAVGLKGRQLSGKLLEQISVKDSTRVSEDLKVLLSQLSAARGAEMISSEVSPRVSMNGDEFGLHLLQKRISLERNESGLSLEGSSVSEIEGESVADRLKRQVERDRKLMGALYKELEEERNASAVAANQAMAMITRLQEEKAALQMEALQCLRLMEEQAEYDSQALQNANDLLAAKEKEIQDLEAELELYKKKLGNMALFEDALEASFDSKRANQADMVRSDDSSNVDKCPVPDFESERQQILLCLNNLEERLHLFSIHDASPRFTNENCEISTEEWVDVGNPKDLDQHESSRNNGKIVENLPLPIAESSGFCVGRDKSNSGQSTDGNSELETLKKDLSVLSGRLKTLEVEHHFLEHSINSLKNGDEGHRFVEEIAGHLRQLHFVLDNTSEFALKQR